LNSALDGGTIFRHRKEPTQTGLMYLVFVLGEMYTIRLYTEKKAYLWLTYVFLAWNRQYTCAVIFTVHQSSLV